MAPVAAPLIGTPMLGNLLKESCVVERLTKASAIEIANAVTLFLGLAIGSTMAARSALLTSYRLLIELDDDLIDRQAFSRLRDDHPHPAILFGFEHVLHFHRLDDRQLLAGGHLLPGAHRNFAQQPRHR